ncbi:hypothetical protein Q0812_11725 [Brevundimonas sp. 2R-24]|uniref:Uncharacterized protein n=1 Tax=Peiella sedimenti TaxID=3061083 RepID=A0ABT8SNE0_9CAUL|nr:hypothetical protein [Caulobacteraceae bacterium XZ-24]
MTDFLHATLGLVDSLHQLVAAIVVLIVCGLAWVFGRSPERWGATAIFLAYIAAPIMQDTTDWVSPQIGLMGVDLALLAVMIWLALRTNRFWPTAAAGLHLLSLLAHVAFILDAGVLALAYIIVLNLIGYLVLAALAVGVFEGRRLDHLNPRSA